MAARALVFDIWQDIVRYSVTYILLVFVVISAFSVIYYSHINRQTTSELEILFSKKDELNIEWRNLLLEQSSLAEHSAIESKAKRLLGMKRPGRDSEVIVSLK
ncbi:MAG: cell division protein FtsL [Colwellia sp.]|uniref:cell division protein FtsL n=1 Tax=Colwellia sp. TaxID=56799 RepID=UPI001DEFE65E|nr:cell division protein FtsL [Colwellia sp.]NQY49496.1 cell division protein FtsL [Colwellia sp.]